MYPIIFIKSICTLYFPGDELRQKIETERIEIERLHQDIAELKEIREDLYDDDSSMSDSSEESEEEEELQELLQQLIRENRQLEVSLQLSLVRRNGFAFMVLKSSEVL